MYELAKKHITPYKGREINFSKPVRIYRNLHRDQYSIQQNGLVMGHCDQMLLHSGSTLVSEKGRQKVIKEKKKNVHAFIVGYIVDNMGCMGTNIERLAQGDKFTNCQITYNPYKYEGFVYKDSEKPFRGADVIYLADRVTVAYGY